MNKRRARLLRFSREMREQRYFDKVTMPRIMGACEIELAKVRAVDRGEA